MVFVGPPDGQFSIGLTNLNHHVPRWGVTPKPIAAWFGGWFRRPVHTKISESSCDNELYPSWRKLSNGRHSGPFMHGRPPIVACHAWQHANTNGGPIAGTAVCDDCRLIVYADFFNRHAANPNKPE